MKWQNNLYKTLSIGPGTVEEIMSASNTVSAASA